MDIQEPEGAAAPSEPTEPESQPLAFTDRYTGLCIVGVLEILCGGMVAMGLVASLHYMVSKGIPRPPGTELSGFSLVDFCLSLATLAIGLIVLGIGIMRARRWAWALNLILSWFAVLMSAWLAIMSCFLAPHDEHGVADLSGFVFLIACVAVSMAFFLFYRDKDVELTCRHRDPVERWTDRRPLPVIAAALLALLKANSLLMNLAPSSTPYYGPFLTGVPATALLLSETGAQIYAAMAMFKGLVSGWWIVLVADIASTAFLVLKVARGADGAWSSLILPVAYLLFVLWLRRYFPHRRLPMPGAARSGL